MPRGASGPRATVAILLAASSLAALAGCASIPRGRYGVSSVDIEGAEEMDERAISACLATYERPRFKIDLGSSPDPECGVPPFDGGRLTIPFWRWPWTDWPIFDRSVFERDVERIQRWYRARGFYDARVLATDVAPPEARMSAYELESQRLEPCEDDCEVEIEIQVVEGEPVLVRSVEIVGLDRVPGSLREPIEESNTLVAGERFDEQTYEHTKRAIQIALANGSYAHARITGRVEVDTHAHTADIRIEIDPGPPCFFGEITVKEHGELPPEPIRDAALINPGDPFSASAVSEAQRAIYALGAFSSVSVAVKIPADRTDTTIPLEVSAAPGRLFRWGLGVGILAGNISLLGTESQSVPQWDVHLLGLVEHRNFLGGLRRLRIEERPRLVFREAFPGTSSPAPGNDLRLELRQPSFLEPRTTLVVGTGWDLGPDPYQGFFRHDVDLFVGPERMFLDGRLLLALRARYNVFVPLDETGTDYTYGEVPSPYQLPFFELFGRLDVRDDPGHPHSGFYFQSGIHEGGFGLPYSWHYLRLTPEVRGYVPLPFGLVIAMRFAIGATFIFDSDEEHLDETSQRLGPQRFRLRGGGSTSVRGYLPGDLGDSRTGGLRRWEASVELRVPVTQSFGVVAFVDAGDVHAGLPASDPLGPEDARFRFDWTHLSVGLGLRYDTIVGPLRLDIGGQVPEAQVIGQPDGVTGRGDDNPTSEVDVGFLQFPGAIHLTIGESF